MQILGIRTGRFTRMSQTRRALLAEDNLKDKVNIWEDYRFADKNELESASMKVLRSILAVPRSEMKLRRSNLGRRADINISAGAVHGLVTTSLHEQGSFVLMRV
jgi:hypothetical protein